MRQSDRTLLCLCFLVSGATSLLLEVAWSKELSYILGNTLYAVATVVASFMAGLGIGSMVASRRAARFRNPVQTYAVLQLAIAACGIGLVHLLRATDPIFAPLYRSLAATDGAFVFVRFVIVFALLLLPTTLMGMTLPVIVGAFGRRQQIYDNVAGLLYGVNTVGAVVGTLLGGFLIIPSLGLWKSCLLAGILDAGVALVVLLLARRTGPIPDRRTSGKPRIAARETGWTGSQWWVASLYGISGLIALVLEVSWFRLLGLTLGPSVYAFAAMLGVYLAGIGLGSTLFAPWVTRARLSGLWIMAGLESTLGLACLAQLFLYNSLPSAYMRVFRSAVENLGTAGFAPSFLVVCGLVVFLPCLLMGALFPAAVRATREAGREVTPEGHVGRLYMLNTAGGIAGSLLTGFWLVPVLGVWRTLIFAGLASVCLGGLLLVRVPAATVRIRLGCIAGTLSVGLLLAVAVPGWNTHLFNLALYRTYARVNRAKVDLGDQELVYYRDGVNAPVAVYRSRGTAALHVSGKADASLSGGDLYTQLLVGHLPISVCAHPRRVAMIGYGSGMTARAILAYPEVEYLDVIEIEQAVLDASPYFASINGNPETDRRTRLVLEDGRIHLKYADGVYDVITSEPSNPWMAGVSNLFTVDFYRAVRTRLAPGGIFGQWIQGYDISEQTFREVVAGLQDTFSHVILFQTIPRDFVVLASDREISIPWETFSSRFNLASVRETYARIGIVNPYQVAFFLHGPEAALRELTCGTPRRNTDDNVRLEYRAPMELMRTAVLGVRTDLGLTVTAAGAERRLQALQRMLPGVPVPDLVREIIAYPHSLDPDPTAQEFTSSMWDKTQQVLARGLELELRKQGRKDLANAVVEWDREGSQRRIVREKLTLEIRELARQARPPDAALMERALREAPDLPYVMVSLGHYLLFGGDENLAEEAYGKAIETPSGYPYFEGLIALARISARRGELDRAEQFCEQAIAWNPYYPRAFALLAEIASIAGREEIAATAIRRGLRWNPSDSDLLRLGERFLHRRS